MGDITGYTDGRSCHGTRDIAIGGNSGSMGPEASSQEGIVQVSQPQHPWPLDLITAVGRCPVHCRVCSSSPGLPSQLDARSICPSI